MKKFIILLIMSVVSFSMMAADIIKTTKGELMEVKVEEVGLGVVKYHRADNMSGPLYLMELSQVIYIQYEGAIREYYTKVEEVAVTAEEEPTEEVEEKVVHTIPVLKYKNSSPSYITADNNIITKDRAYEIMGDNYDDFLINRKKWKTSKPLWAVGILSTAIAGPTIFFIGMGRERPKLHAVGLSIMISGVAEMAIGLNRHHKYKERALELLDMDYLY